MKTRIIVLMLLMVGTVYASTLLSLQNVLQIPNSLESVTNVFQKTPEIIKYYNNNKTKLPRSGQVTEFSAQTALAMVSYSSLFCGAMIKNDASLSPNQRWAHSYVDFNVTLSQLSETTRNQVYDEYAEMFWQRAITAEERQVLNDDYNELTQDLNNSKESVLQVLTMICSIYASTFGFLAY